MFCPYCGREGIRKAEYCSECGKKLPELEWEQETENPRGGLTGTGERKQTTAESDLQQLEDLLEPYSGSTLTFGQEVKRRDPEKYAETVLCQRREDAYRIWCPNCGTRYVWKIGFCFKCGKRRSKAKMIAHQEIPSCGEGENISISTSDLKELRELAKPYSGNALSFEEEVERRDPDTFAKIALHRRMYKTTSRIQCPNCGERRFELDYRYYDRFPTYYKPGVEVLLKTAFRIADNIKDDKYGPRYKCLHCGNIWRSRGVR